MRVVPEYRIKRFNGDGKISVVESYSQIDTQKLREDVIAQIAIKFALALEKHHRITIRKQFGVAEFRASLDAIVPERPPTDGGFEILEPPKEEDEAP